MAELMEMYKRLNEKNQTEVKALVIALVASQQSPSLHTPDSLE